MIPEGCRVLLRLQSCPLAELFLIQDTGDEGAVYIWNLMLIRVPIYGGA